MTDAPSHAIRQLAFLQVSPSLAHTLAECLFWYQKATYKIDGELAVWKTGPPVTWLIPLEPGLELLRHARSAMGENSAKQSFKKSSKASSLDGPADDQMSVEPTSLHLPSLLPGQSPLHCPTGTQAEKSKSKSTSWDPGKEASEEARILLEAMNAYRLQHAALCWDNKSKFTWEHMEALAVELKKKGVPADAWPRFVEEVHDHWAFIRENLPKPYQVHSSNVSNPSSKPLGDEARTVVSLVLKLWADRAEAAAKTAAKGTSSSHLL